MAVAIRQMTYAQAINEAIRMEMRRNPRVILMGEDVAGGATVDHLQDDEAWGGVLGVTKGLVQEFGRDRVLDTPITEAGFIGAAVGAAATGMRPIAELMFVDFFGVCWDQIYNQGAKLRYMFGGKASCPARDPHDDRCWYGCGWSTFRLPLLSLYAYAWHQNGCTEHSGRCKRFAGGCHS